MILPLVLVLVALLTLFLSITCRRALSKMGQKRHWRRYGTDPYPLSTPAEAFINMQGEVAITFRKATWRLICRFAGCIRPNSQAGSAVK